MQIRSMRPDEIEPARLLLAANHWSPRVEVAALFRELVARSHVALVAVEDNLVVGFLRAISKGGSAPIISPDLDIRASRHAVPCTLVNTENPLKSRRLWTALFAAGGFAALVGCGSVAPENLHRVNSGATLDVQRDLRWDYPSTFVDWQELLLAGTYHAVAEDPDGTYFLGDRPCFFQTRAEGGSKQGKHIWGRANVCGVYVPKMPGKPLKVFEVLGPVVDRIVLDEDGTPVANLYAGGDTATSPNTRFVDLNALVAGTAALEKGRYQMVPIQPPEGMLQGALKFR